MLDVSVAATLQNMLSRLLDPEVEGSNHPSEHLLDALRRQLPPVDAGLNKDNLMSMSETSIFLRGPVLHSRSGVYRNVDGTIRRTWL